MSYITKEDFLHNREDALVGEARGLIGMLAEVAAKARLLINGLKKYSATDAQEYADRLNDDYDRYTCRISDINDELVGVYHELDKFYGLDC